MFKRVFTQPTVQEIEEKENVERGRVSLGIDLMGFDD